MKYISSGLSSPHVANANRWRGKVKSLQFLLTTLLFLSVFLMTSLTTKADWWNGNTGESYGAKDHFKVSFNNTTGQFTIRAFAIDKGYFAHNTLATSYAKLSYTTDGVNYIPFYQFKFNSRWQDTPDQSGYLSAQSLDSHADGYRTTYDMIMHLNLFNDIRDIKSIKIECDLESSDGGEDKGNSAIINYTVPQVTFNIKGYSYQEDNRVKVDWNSKWNNDNDVLVANSSTAVFDASGTKIADLGYGLSSGSFYTNQSNQSKEYHFVHSSYSGKITDDVSIVVPAFTHPSGITAV
ncbi:MAG: hypothetical protein ABIN04_02450, partial [Ginsengibacter sp.]